MFIEPIFTLIISDMVVRLCSLRNEKQVSNKLKPLNKFIGALALLRVLSLIPELFFYVERVTLISYEGGTHYQMNSELSPHY